MKKFLAFVARFLPAFAVAAFAVAFAALAALFVSGAAFAASGAEGVTTIAVNDTFLQALSIVASILSVGAGIFWTVHKAALKIIQNFNTAIRESEERSQALTRALIRESDERSRAENAETRRIVEARLASFERFLILHAGGHTHIAGDGGVAAAGDGGSPAVLPAGAAPAGSASAAASVDGV